MRRWLEAKAFAAHPDDRAPEKRYVIMMPLPNVTGALHMGHAMDNVMQDLLIRWHRMMGDNTLWMPGTDHAGIATQAVVEKRLLELEGKTRHDIGREALVERIWDWKDEYQARIVAQQQQMGCSCDWDRQRFTMDAVCAAAVRETFFRLFGDGLIYRGNRLVNWDCQLQTAVSDDEIVPRDTSQGHFWHLRYPVIDPEPGEPDSRDRGHHPARDHARRHRRGRATPTPRARWTSQHRRAGRRSWPAAATRRSAELEAGARAPGGAPRDAPAPPERAGRHGPGRAARSCCRCSSGRSRSSSTSGPSRSWASGCVKITPGPRPQRLRRLDSATRTRSTSSTS